MAYNQIIAGGEPPLADFCGIRIENGPLAMRKLQDRPFARSANGKAESILLISGNDRIRLRVEEARKDHRSARRKRFGEVSRQLDQRPSEDVGDDQVERRPGVEHWRVHAVRYCKQ